MCFSSLASEISFADNMYHFLASVSCDFFTGVLSQQMNRKDWYDVADCLPSVCDNLVYIYISIEVHKKSEMTKHSVL